MNRKSEFGDFQTPDDLAAKVTGVVAALFGIPELVVEPTAGLGAFLKAAVEQWGRNCRYEGYEINQDYVQRAGQRLKGYGVEVFRRDFFMEDWKYNLNRSTARKVLVIGNPPWITNSDLSLLESRNLPVKTNFQKLRGLDARTGKSNFDIAEWMIIKLIEALPPEGCMAMLCKTMTARKVLRHFWKTDGGRAGSRLFRIDAKVSFNVAVDACLLVITGHVIGERTAVFSPTLDLCADSTQFGLVNGELVSDTAAYHQYKDFEGGSSAYIWRSGVKHDAAKVMEFVPDGCLFRNGLGESVELESEQVYPLLKSSDIGNRRTEPRKYILITQSHTGYDTSSLSFLAPKTWNYLMDHAKFLDGRRSAIYRNRPRFSIFGIGEYSFAPWKVAISGLYKRFSFVVIPPFDERSVIIDDTCYSIPCGTEAEARLLCEILSSEPVLRFLESIVFIDAKRPITIDILRRISLIAAARYLGRLDEFQHYLHSGQIQLRSGRQVPLIMEKKRKYKTQRLHA